MSGVEQRGARRIACEIPLQLRGDGGRIVARAVDLSRTGLRMRIPGKHLGVHRLSSLVQVARRVSGVLGQMFTSEFDPDRLGGLIHKDIQVVRIAQRDWESADVDLGCLLAEPFTDEEAGMLGVALPQIGESRAPDTLSGTRPEVRGSDDAKTAKPKRPRLRAYLYARGAPEQAPIPTYATHVDAQHALLTIPDIAGLGFAETPKDVSHFVMALDEGYGSELRARIVDGAREVWSGNVSLLDAELRGQQPTQAILGVDFETQLAPEDLARMGAT